MGSATVQLVGNVATELKISMENAGHERVSFRVIASERRFDAATNEWVDGDEFAVNVVCWGALARGVETSVRIGDPVVVTGRIISRKYEVEGVVRFATEVKAATVSHDLNRGTDTFRRSHLRPAGSGVETDHNGAHSDDHYAASATDAIGAEVDSGGSSELVGAGISGRDRGAGNAGFGAVDGAEPPF
ncbi:single-stranded DNA-binding protein [Nakamurella antarctica]|nr:single-stranded DNA-binding protein [Nakamurella antarctica]